MNLLFLVQRYYKELAIGLLIIAIGVYIFSLKSEIAAKTAIISTYKLEMVKLNADVTRLISVNGENLETIKFIKKDSKKNLEKCLAAKDVLASKEGELITLINSLKTNLKNKPPPITTTVIDVIDCEVIVEESTSLPESQEDKTLLDILNEL